MGTAVEGQDGQRGFTAGNAVLPQPRARRGRGSTPGFPGPSSWASDRAGGGLFAGGGLQIRPGNRPDQVRRALRTLPASGRGSQDAGKAVLTLVGARPAEERACSFPVCHEMLLSPPATAAG